MHHLQFWGALRTVTGTRAGRWIGLLGMPCGLSPVIGHAALYNGLSSGFLTRTCTEVSGVENIGQCDRLSQLSWLLGAL